MSSLTKIKGIILIVILFVTMGFSQNNAIDNNRCSIVSIKEDCLNVDQLDGVVLQVPRNVTRLETNYLNVCNTDSTSVKGVDLIYVVDNSGSMYTKDRTNSDGVTVIDSVGMDPNGKRYEAVDIALEEQVKKFGNNSRAAIIEFSDSEVVLDSTGTISKTRIIKPLTFINEDNYDSDFTALTDTNFALNGGTYYGLALDLVDSVITNAEATDVEERLTLVFFITDGEPKDNNAFTVLSNQIADGVANKNGNSVTFPPIHMFFISPEDPMNSDDETTKSILTMMIDNTKGSHTHINSDNDENIGKIADHIKTIVDKATEEKTYTSINLSSGNNSVTGSLNGEKITFSNVLPLQEGNNELTFSFARDIFINNQLVENREENASFTIDVSGNDVDDKSSGAVFNYECGPTEIKVFGDKGRLIDVGDSLNADDKNIIVELNADGFTGDKATLDFSVLLTEDQEQIEAQGSKGSYKTNDVAIHVGEKENNGALDVNAVDQIVITWKHPSDPRDTALRVVDGIFLHAIPEFIMYDEDGDGRADKMEMKKLHSWLLGAELSKLTFTWGELEDYQQEVEILAGELDIGDSIVHIFQEPLLYGATSPGGPLEVEVENGGGGQFFLVDKVSPVIVSAFIDEKESTADHKFTDVMYSEFISLQDDRDLFYRLRQDSSSLEWKGPTNVNVERIHNEDEELFEAAWKVKTVAKGKNNILIGDSIKILVENFSHVVDSAGNEARVENPYVVVGGSKVVPIQIDLGTEKSIVVHEIKGDDPLTGADDGQNKFDVVSIIPSGGGKIVNPLEIATSHEDLTSGVFEDNTDYGDANHLIVNMKLTINSLEDKEDGNINVFKENLVRVKLMFYDQVGQYLNTYEFFPKLEAEHANEKNEVELAFRLYTDSQDGLVSFNGRAIGSCVLITRVLVEVTQSTENDGNEVIEKAITEEFINIGYRVVK